MAAVPELLQQQEEDRSKVRPSRPQAPGQEAPPTSPFLSHPRGLWGASCTRSSRRAPRRGKHPPAAERPLLGPRRAAPGAPPGPRGGPGDAGPFRPARAPGSAPSGRVASLWRPGDVLSRRLPEFPLASWRLGGERETHSTGEKRPSLVLLPPNCSLSFEKTLFVAQILGEFHHVKPEACSLQS